MVKSFITKVVILHIIYLCILWVEKYFRDNSLRWEIKVKTASESHRSGFSVMKYKLN